eukprot:GGOE01062255.1.p1 GENE.GGOE01062255.1~~GGOE01062255.1.p1  ORF type:complete len:910 (-),score=313.83 GGOE01062255.1:8-2737(-)
MDGREHRAAFLHAVKKGEVALVQKFLQSSDLVDLSVTDPTHGATLLHWACDGGHIEVVKLLLISQADPNATARSGATPLHWAIGPGSLDLCRVLLANRADPHAMDVRQMSPIDLAKQRGHTDVVRLLLQDIVGSPRSRLGSRSSSVSIPTPTHHGSDGLRPGSARNSMVPIHQVDPKCRDTWRNFVDKPERELSTAMVSQDSLDTFLDSVHLENAHLKQQLTQMRSLPADCTQSFAREEKFQQELEVLQMQVQALELHNAQLEIDSQAVEGLRGQVKSLEERNAALHAELLEMDVLRDQMKSLEMLNAQLRLSLQAALAEDRQNTRSGQQVRAEATETANFGSDGEPPSTIPSEPVKTEEPRPPESPLMMLSSCMSIPSIRRTLTEAGIPGGVGERQFTGLSEDLEAATPMSLDGLRNESVEFPEDAGSQNMKMRHRLKTELNTIVDMETRIQQSVLSMARAYRMVRIQRDGHRARLSILQGMLERQKKHNEDLQHTLWDAQERLKDAVAAGVREDALRHESECLRAAMAKLRTLDASQRQEIVGLQATVQQLRDQLRDSARQPEFMALKVKHATLAERCHELTEEVQRLKYDLQWLRSSPCETIALSPTTAILRRTLPNHRLYSDRTTHMNSSRCSGLPPSMSEDFLSPSMSPTKRSSPVLGPSPYAKHLNALQRTAIIDIELDQEAHYARITAEQLEEWRRLLTEHEDGLDALQDGLEALAVQAGGEAVLSSMQPLSLSQRSPSPITYPSLEDLSTLQLLYVELCQRQQAAVHYPLLMSLPPLPEELRELELIDNRAGRQGVVCVADLMELCCNLSRVVLVDNKVDNETMVYFAGKVEDHPTLQSIVLRNNGFSKAGGRALLHAVQVNTNLTEVVIDPEPFLIPSLKQRIEAQALLNRQLRGFTASG